MSIIKRLFKEYFSRISFLLTVALCLLPLYILFPIVLEAVSIRFLHSTASYSLDNHILARDIYTKNYNNFAEKFDYDLDVFEDYTPPL